MKELQDDVLGTGTGTENDENIATVDPLEQEIVKSDQKTPRGSAKSSTKAPSQTKKVTTALPEDDLEFSEFGNYKPREDEKHLYHILMRENRFHEVTRERLRRPFVQIYTPREYKQQSPLFKQLGFDATAILWNPEA